MTSSRIVHTIPPWATPSQPSNRRSSASSRPRPARLDVEDRAASPCVVAASPQREAVVRRELEAPSSALDGDRRAVVADAQMSRFWTLRASVLMKSLRGPTFSPISIVKISSAGAAFSDVDAQQGPRLRVHRRLPELVGVHLAEALEPLDGQVLDVELLDDLVALLLGLGVAA